MTIDHSKTDYWFYTIGVNVIAVDSKNKKPTNGWKNWQNKPIPIETYEEWKKQGLLDKGIALITGRIWRGDYDGKYLECVDIDNKKGIEDFLSHFPYSKTLEELAEVTIVEQHSDNKEDKAHIYFITESLVKKRSRIIAVNSNINQKDIPAIEIKSDGTTLIICSPSIHKNGHQYQIIGTKDPKVLNKEQTKSMEIEIDKLYQKYLYNNQKSPNQNTTLSDGLRNIAKTLKIEKSCCKIPEGLRNDTLFALANYILHQHSNTLDIGELKGFFFAGKPNIM